MTTAFELGRLTARVKMAADPQTAPAAIPTNPFKEMPAFDPSKPADARHAVSNVARPASIRMPPKEAIPHRTRSYPYFTGYLGLEDQENGNKTPYFGSEKTTTKFVPQTPFPERNPQTWANLGKKYYTNLNPADRYDGPAIGTRGHAYAAADKLYPSKFPIHALATHGKFPTSTTELLMQAITRPAGIIGSGLQTYARGRYEQRLNNMRDTAFNDRTSTPFYYTTDSRDGDPHVLMQTNPATRLDPKTNKLIPIPTATILQSPDKLSKEIKNVVPVSMVTPAIDLHEHVHTTQLDPNHHNNRPNYPKDEDYPRLSMQAELPAVTSEAAHVSDAYNYATGQWPEGMHLGMTMQQLTEDLRRRGHIGGATQMSEIMNDPDYRRRLDNALNKEDPVYKEDTAALREKLFPRQQFQWPTRVFQRGLDLTDREQRFPVIIDPVTGKAQPEPANFPDIRYPDRSRGFGR